MNSSAPLEANIDEIALITSVKAGNADDFRPLVECYQAGVVRYIFYLVRDQDIAEDIAQEAFVIAYQKLHQYNKRYAFSTWLYRIARNLAYQYLRSNRTLPLKFEDNLESDKPEPSESIDKDIEATRIRSAIATLNPDQRTVVYLHYWEGRRYKEIADILDKPVNTIRTWLRRAKQELRSKL